jgi:hypothetical protein
VAENVSARQTPEIERTVSQMKSVTSSFAEPQSNQKSACSDDKPIDVIDEQILAQVQYANDLATLKIELSD